jgi:GNAT superfamily N-acetyltransferase
VFQIRKATPADAMAMTLVNVYTWKTTYTGLMPDEIIDRRIRNILPAAQRIKQQLEQQPHHFVALVENCVVGFCMIGPTRNEQYPQAGEIAALYILQGLQGMGIGKALYEAAVQELKQQGYTSMIANCLRGNPVLGFYQHMGGSIVGEKTELHQGVALIEDVIYFELSPDKT